MKRRPEECYDLIENMTTHHNDWDTFVQRSESSSSITSSSDPEIVALKAKMAKINKNIMKVLQINQQVKAVTHNCETYGGPHSYNDCPVTVGQTQNVYAARAYNQGGNSYQPQGNCNLLSYHSDNYLGPSGFNHNQNRCNQNQNYQNQNRNQGNNHGIPQRNNQGRNQFFQGAGHGQNPPLAYQAPTYQSPGYQTLVHQALIPQPNIISNPKEDLKGITTRSGNAYKGPTIPTTSSSLKVVERETEVTKDTVTPTNNGSTKDVQPLVVQVKNQIPNSEPVVAPVVEPVEAPTGQDFIDVYEGELTLRVGKEVVTLNLDQTSRYSANYDAMSVNRIDLTDVACEEDSDFLFEETDAFLAINDEPISPEVDDCYYDSKGDILFLEEFFNDDPSSPPLPPQELKVVEPTNEKISTDEPPVVELKDLPPYLGYAFLEGDDKLPVIIAKDLKDEEKTALIKVLKSHKQSLAWQLFDIKSINPEFCTHNILMEDDFKSAVQHQRRVNPKIHEVIKKEILKLLDAGLIYPILDSPWTPKIKKRSHSRVLTECLPTIACLLAYAMHQMLKWYEDTNLFLNWEKSNFMVKEGIVLDHKISKNGIEVDKAKVDVIAKLPHPTNVKGAVLGQQKTKHFHPIHYASKTMTDAQAHYTTTEKELLAVVGWYLYLNFSWFFWVGLFLGIRYNKEGISGIRGFVELSVLVPGVNEDLQGLSLDFSMLPVCF
uniref:Reverse transcriptase domain-containing protein n=1 Tax=Tanacetum cinerariifolium TaxID=118510 RepID=A0A6L2KMM2_TANCI|nr:reverse transcriptase domain-containing protein [Tanacetum cinerariifolium]